MPKTTYLKGIWAELYVMCFLILKGYRILAWRMRNPISEIDLIAKKGKILIAIEVKYRKSFDEGLYAITSNQQRKIRSAFDLYRSSYAKAYHTLRCDICIVNKWGCIRHLHNAF